jgi:hypothetical protein
MMFLSLLLFFQTDWNDGYFLCAIVHSLGGSIPGWPNLDRKNKEENCQKGNNLIPQI